MELILGTAGQPHVTSQQMREIFKMVVGSGSYILNSGEYLEPELQSNQALRIRSGILMHHGGIAEVKQNTYDEVTIGNGTQGMKRIDLVVARYTKDPETEHETMTWVVIQGTPAASDPVAPAYTEGDMQNGDLTDDCPVFEVHLDGIQVTDVVKLVEILDCDLSSLNGKISGAAGQIVYCGLINLLYNNSTDLQGVVNDAPADIFDNLSNYAVLLTLRNASGTPYNQVSRLTYEVRTAQRVLVLDGYGSGFVSGHVVSVSVLIVKKQ